MCFQSDHFFCMLLLVFYTVQPAAAPLPPESLRLGLFVSEQAVRLVGSTGTLPDKSLKSKNKTEHNLTC